MTSSNNPRAKYIHALKGPERLAPDVVKDIIESRGISGARKTLAKKYGISETRVGRLWVEYYGGGKLSDYKSGIKKPLPVEPINNSDITVRNLKTVRGEYKVREPKVEKIDPKKDAKSRAAPTKVYRPSRDLVIDDTEIDNITDQDAEIIAGEIGAGNNNPALIDVFNRLIESRDRDTEYLYKLAKRGLKKSNYESEMDYDSTNIEEDTADDDSTAFYKQKVQQPRGATHAQREGGDGRNSECQQLYYSPPNSNASNAGMVLWNNNLQPVEGLRSEHKGEPIRPPGSGARAQPVFIGLREATDREAQQINTNESIRYEPALSPAEYNPSQRGLQQNNSNNINQCVQKPGQSQRVPGTVGDSAGQTVPGIPWLRIRPY